MRRRRKRTRSSRRTRRSSRSRRTASRHRSRKAGSYWSDVKTIADYIEEEKDEYLGADVTDMIHESVDGSSNIIYTNKAMEVLQETDNRNAYFDHMGGSISAKSTDEVVTQLAYYAMYQDVADELYDRGVY